MFSSVFPDAKSNAVSPRRLVTQRFDVSPYASEVNELKFTVELNLLMKWGEDL